MNKLFDTIPNVNLSLESLQVFMGEKSGTLSARRVTPSPNEIYPRKMNNPNTWNIEHPGWGMSLGQVTAIKTGDCLALRFWYDEDTTDIEKAREHLKRRGRLQEGFELLDPAETNHTREAFIRAARDEIVSDLQRVGALVETTKSEAALPVNDAPTETQRAGDGQPDSEKIPDHAWDRQAVEMLYEGHTDSEIANQLNKALPNPISAKTVTNRLSVLRGQFQFIKTREELRRAK